MPILDSVNNTEMESLNALFEYATEGILVADKSGIITKANPSSEKLFGYAKDELLGKMVEDLMPQRYAKNHHHHREGYNKDPHPRSMGKNMDLLAKRLIEKETIDIEETRVLLNIPEHKANLHTDVV